MNQKKSLLPPVGKGRYLALILLSLIGFGSSLYLSWHYYGLRSGSFFKSACNLGGMMNCDVVAASPYADRVEIREGPALDTIAGLDGPFDLVFVDADKTNYVNYYEAVLPKLAERGLIVVDNTLWSGAVLDESDTSADTEAIRAFNDHVRADPRVVCVQLTVRDGVTLIRRR